MRREFKHSFKSAEREQLSLVVYNVGFQKCPPDYGWGPGVRDHYLIHYVVSGRGIYESETGTFVLGAGDAFLVRPEEMVCYRADREEPWEYYWVGFSGPMASLLLTQTPFAVHRPVVHLKEGFRFRQALLEIYKARGTDYPSAVRMAGYLQAALGLLMETRSKEEESVQSRCAREGAAYLEQNYFQPICVEDAARQAGVSRSCLYRAFQKEFGCPPSAYLTRCRLRRACVLLRHSTLSVGEVAFSVGYEDRLYFSRAFRREMGCSPTEYREKKNEEDDRT